MLDFSIITRVRKILNKNNLGELCKKCMSKKLHDLIIFFRDPTIKLLYQKSGFKLQN